MTSTVQTPYVLPVNEAEWARLDAQSDGIDNFLGNKLCPEDIGQPRNILEIGAGSGAWAIRAAKQYPTADVVAVDMNPLPARPLPSNLRFQQINVLEPFPFPAGSFDVVHIRLVLCHLPDGLAVLSRIIDLVSPGGWLLVDDIDWSANFQGLDKAPAIKGVLSALVKSMEAVHGSPHFGKTLKPYLEASSVLSEVHVREVDVPLGSTPEEPTLAALSQTWKTGLMRAIGAATVKQSAEMEEMKQGFLDEMTREGLDWQYSCQLYFAWSKKRV